jgi:hypothetical protein
MKSRLWIPSRKKTQTRPPRPSQAGGERRPEPPRIELRSVAVNRLDAWRGAADDVEAAARHWRSVPETGRPSAALVYFAALDREEKAAGEYERACGTLRDSL